MAENPTFLMAKWPFLHAPNRLPTSDLIQKQNREWRSYAWHREQHGAMSQIFISLFLQKLDFFDWLEGVWGFEDLGILGILRTPPDPPLPTLSELYEFLLFLISLKGNPTWFGEKNRLHHSVFHVLTWKRSNQHLRRGSSNLGILGILRRGPQIALCIILTFLILQICRNAESKQDSPLNFQDNAPLRILIRHREQKLTFWGPPSSNLGILGILRRGPQIPLSTFLTFLFVEICKSAQSKQESPSNFQSIAPLRILIWRL